MFRETIYAENININVCTTFSYCKEVSKKIYTWCLKTVTARHSFSQTLNRRVKPV